MFFSVFSYESMIIHLQETWKNTEQGFIWFLYTFFLKVDAVSLVGVSSSRFCVALGLFGHPCGSSWNSPEALLSE